MDNSKKDLTMSDKEKADCLIALHKEQLSKFKQTRTIEFKINMVLWSAIVIAGYHLKDKFLLKYCCDYLIYILISCFIGWAYYKFWMFPITKSEETDGYYINKYRYEVEKLTGIIITKNPDNNSDPKQPKKVKPEDINCLTEFDKGARNWIIFEVGITAFLLFIVGVYLSL